MTRPSRRPARGAARRDTGGRTQRLPESAEVITIDRIAAGGDGVGRAGGMAVFVPRTAPGDVAQVAYVAHARHGRGRVLQLLTPSPHRVTPACVHYERDRCGGCQLQHLDAPTQREARRHIVQDTLAGIGRRDIPLPVLVHGAEWGYRGRLTLTLRRRGQGWVGGLHPHDDPTRVFALDSCLIAHPTLGQVWASVRSLLRAPEPALPTVALAQGRVEPAESLRLSLRLDEDGAAGEPPGVQLVLEGGNSWPQQEAWTAAVRAAEPRVRGVWWTRQRRTPEPGTDRSGAGASTRGRGRGSEAAEVAVEYAPQAHEALAFAQVNADVARALREYVYDAVQRFGPRRVVDGYAGTGALSARLVEAGVSVVAVEADAAGAEAAVARLRATTAAPDRTAAAVRVVCDLMEHALQTIDERVDVVVLNPPRRGVHPDVTAWLESPAQRGVAGLVYVSCDPATLARDLARLPSWCVAEVRCFDMFPQTAHVETVCVLRREIP